jgi:competence ComEA-like helix-hairpin-helix protein
MEDEAELAHARAQALEQEARELRTELGMTRAALDRVRAEADRMEDEAEQAHARVQALEGDLARAVSQAEGLRTDLEAEQGSARRIAEEEARRQAEVAEEARRRSNEEAQRAEEASVPRPKVPVWADPRPINVNTADLEELQLLPGIGRRPAERIIAAREESGGFTSLDELFAIEQLPRERIARIRPHVTV